MNRAEKDERPLLVPAVGFTKEGERGFKVVDFSREKELYRQWTEDHLEAQLAQARANNTEDINNSQKLSTEERLSLFLLSLPPIPPYARSVSEQIFRWGITVTQFTAIQKALEIPLYLDFTLREGIALLSDIYIAQEEINLVENSYPDCKRAAKECQSFFDALSTLEDNSFIYPTARQFWGHIPVEMAFMRCKLFKLYNYFCEVDKVSPEQKTTTPPRAWLPRYVERLYAEGKTQQEIAIDLRKKDVPLTVIAALLREDEGFLGDYRQWIKKKGWFKREPKDQEE